MATTANTPPKLARRAGLKYIADDEPGISRIRSGQGFAYRDARGRSIRGARIRQRIDALAIPPAWKAVWICPSPQGHLQATGRDAKGRKQYRYHDDWTSLANLTKFDKLRAFGECLPGLRAHVARHLALPGIPRRKVIATLVELLDRTLLRVGNEEYVRSNQSYGLTTLRDRHAQARGDRLRLRFRGKSGVEHEVWIRDRRVARIVRTCQDLPGQELFQYRDQRNQLRRVESTDVNQYLQEAAGQLFTAKDFRTWKATALVLEQLLSQSQAGLTMAAAKRAVNDAIRQAAAALGNTQTICRKYYVHPQIVELFLAGNLTKACGRAVTRRQKRMAAIERQLLRLLRHLEK